MKKAVKMKRVNKKRMDVVGDLPANLKPKEKSKPSTYNLPKYLMKMYNLSGDNCFIRVYDRTRTQEGMEAPVVWESPVNAALVASLVQWVKTQTIALQYRQRNVDPVPFVRDIPEGMTAEDVAMSREVRIGDDVAERFRRVVEGSDRTQRPDEILEGMAVGPIDTRNTDLPTVQAELRRVMDLTLPGAIVQPYVMRYINQLRRIETRLQAQVFSSQSNVHSGPDYRGFLFGPPGNLNEATTESSGGAVEREAVDFRNMARNVEDHMRAVEANIETAPGYLQNVRRELQALMESVPPGWRSSPATMNRVTILRTAENRLLALIENHETAQQRWARERWDESLAGVALAQRAAERENRSMDDIALNIEQDPDRNNNTGE